MIKYLIFDLDGTLYEKQSVVIRYLKVFAEKENFDFTWLHEQFTSAYILAKTGTYPTTTDFWSKVHDIFMVSIQSSKRNLLESLALEAKEDALLGIQARSDIKELLEKAKLNGMKVVIFTVMICTVLLNFKKEKKNFWPCMRLNKNS
ncbi:MAG: HAD hydrolase-like protein [bacterium]|nr:HAD hydrolase-like protein [bacterium]